MFDHEVSLNWHAISLKLPVDFHMDIIVEDVNFIHYQFGLGLYETLETIFKIREKPVRILPYRRLFQVAVTYEIDSTKYEFFRLEFSFFDWLSSIGGLSSIILAVSTAIGALESPQRYVVSALIGKSKDDDTSSKKDKPYGPHDMQVKCLPGLQTKVVMSSWLPKCCCVPACGSTRARMLGEGYKALKSSMYIHNLIKQLRTTEGIIREKLEINDQEWDKAVEKYGMWYHEGHENSQMKESSIANEQEKSSPIDSSFRSNSQLQNEGNSLTEIKPRGSKATDKAPQQFVKTQIVSGSNDMKSPNRGGVEMTRRASGAQNSLIRAGDQSSIRKTLSNAELDELEDLDDGLDAYGS